MFTGILASLSSVPVGLALREQILEKASIPMDDNDWSMDLIVTPDEVLIKSTSTSDPL